MTIDKDAVQKMFDTCAKAFSEMDEITKEMLMTFCIVTVQMKELNKRIEQDGLLIEIPKGNYTVLKEHPAVNTKHKLTADQARCYAPLKRVLKAQADQSAEDELDAFLGL